MNLSFILGLPFGLEIQIIISVSRPISHLPHALISPKLCNEQRLNSVERKRSTSQFEQCETHENLANIYTQKSLMVKRFILINETSIIPSFDKITIVET